MNAMSKKKGSRPWWLLLAVFIAAAIVWAYREPAVAVSVTAVDRGPLEVVVEEEGRARIRERFVVAVPVAGYMQRVAVHVGDEVRAGDVLFTLEPLPPVALDARTRAEAEARVVQAGAAERAAQSELQAAVADADFTER
jgi:HlyD family secretion protein